MSLRHQLIVASQEHFKAHIEKHRMNVEVMLASPIAIPEHTDIMTAIERELEEIAKYDDLLSVLKRYFDEG